MDARDTAAGGETTFEEALTVRSPEPDHESRDESEAVPTGRDGTPAPPTGGPRFASARVSGTPELARKEPSRSSSERPDDTARQGSGGGGSEGRRRGRRRAPKKGSFWRELPILVVLALGLALLIKTFLIQAFYIPSESMENTLVPGDRVLVNKLSYNVGDVQRGDVIVFNGVNSWEPEVNFPEPDNVIQQGLRSIGELFGFAPIGERDFIKRVIGLPGDRVKCCDNDGLLMVNGTPVKESDYLFPGDAASITAFDQKVPEGRLWVMGDHRSASADSRAHLGDPGGGTIPVDRVIGRAFVIVWPLDRLDILSRPDAFVQAGVPE